MDFSGPVPVMLNLLLFFFVSLSSSAPGPTADKNFLQCISDRFPSNDDIFKVIYTPNNTSYSSILNSSIENFRFLSQRQPLFIVAPTDVSHVQAAVICTRNHGFRIRVRSGGHDYEGQSYTADTDFVLVDLVNLRKVDVNLEEGTAWVQAGANIGEVYYKIAGKSSLHGFSAGLCPTVGVGGLFAGGGIGTLMRKYGIAADNIIDAYIVDANGTVLNRTSMGEDLFWAIRGGGSASFGVIFSWKIKLVPVPPVVTVFTVIKFSDEGGVSLLSKWQQIAHQFDENLFLRVILTVHVVQQEGRNLTRTQAAFNSIFLGGAESLLQLMNKSFPELGLQRKDCEEMSWIRSVLYFAGLPHGEKDPTDVLLERVRKEKNKDFYKGKSDFVAEPVPEDVLQRIWNKLEEDPAINVVIDPLGGKMSEISESEIAFPHRKGNLYNIQYVSGWDERDEEAAQRHIDWINGLYLEMTPYVSKNPRAAYINYRDLYLGKNEEGNVSYSLARVWGEKYFKNNFRRLALIKGRVDPTNFFENAQSIPPLVE